jgi:hypothetical protein
LNLGYLAQRRLVIVHTQAALRGATRPFRNPTNAEIRSWWFFNFDLRELRRLANTTNFSLGGCALRQEGDVYSSDVAWSAHPVRGEM